MVQKRGGNVGPALGGRTSRGTSRSGRGRSAALRLGSSAYNRRVTVKARIIQHRSLKFSAAPLSRHLAYLQRDGVTRDDRDAEMFDRSEEHTSELKSLMRSSYAVFCWKTTKRLIHNKSKLNTIL